MIALAFPLPATYRRMVDDPSIPAAVDVWARRDELLLRPVFIPGAAPAKTKDLSCWGFVASVTRGTRGLTATLILDLEIPTGGAFLALGWKDDQFACVSVIYPSALQEATA